MHTAHQAQTPKVEMLHGDDHDDGRQRRTRNAAKPAEKKAARDQQRGGIDQNRQRRARAESAVGDAGADIGAAGDAAEAPGRHIGDAKLAQHAITVTPCLARCHDELCAKQRIDRGNDRERQCAAENGRRQLQQIAAAL
jgi:hypothetical protein